MTSVHGLVMNHVGWSITPSVCFLIRHYQAKLKLYAISESKCASLFLPVNAPALTLCVWPYLNASAVVVVVVVVDRTIGSEWTKN